MQAGPPLAVCLVQVWLCLAVWNRCLPRTAPAGRFCQSCLFFSVWRTDPCMSVEGRQTWSALHIVDSQCLKKHSPLPSDCHFLNKPRVFSHTHFSLTHSRSISHFHVLSLSLSLSLAFLSHFLSLSLSVCLSLSFSPMLTPIHSFSSFHSISLSLSLSLFLSDTHTHTHTHTPEYLTS